MLIFIIVFGSVVQWIERKIADLVIQVRFLVGAMAMAGELKL